MSSVHKALADIAALRSQLARSTEFRGYGPATLAATAGLAAAAALAQGRWLPAPAADIGGYLALWIGTALLSLGLIGLEAVTRSRRLHSGLADAMIRQAIEQFLPAAAAGVLLTLVLTQTAPASLWMLPGLWQVVMSLGVFASCRSLPRPLLAVGLWYLASGLGCLAWAQDDLAFSPWAMGLPFAVGQGLAALLLQVAGGRDGQA